MKKCIYLDNNATTVVAPEVFDAIKPYLTDDYFNPNGMYSAAKGPAEAITNARARVATFLGDVNPAEIIFTSCATESNNAAIFGAINANPQRRHIITSVVEHPAVLQACKEAERRGCTVTFLPVDRNGEIDIDEYVHALNEDTLMVSLMHANNETGVIFPIAELARIAKEVDKQILFHSDATQSLGKVPLNLQEDSDIDMLSFSGHKMYAPKGVGVLFMRRGTRCRPTMIGGHQENGHRAGTQNIAYIASMGRACDLATEHMKDEDSIRELRDRLQGAIIEKIPAVEVNGRDAPRLPNTLNIACHGVEGEAILYELDEYGICASSGSACTSGSLDSSHVLNAMQVPFSAIHGSVRFSIGRYNTSDEIDRIIEIFPKIIARLRKMSPFWNDETNQLDMDQKYSEGQECTQCKDGKCSL